MPGDAHGQRAPAGGDGRLRERFPDTLVLQFDPQGVRELPTPYAAAVRQRDDLDLCCDFLAHVRGGNPPTEAERTLLGSAVEGSRRDRARHDDEGQTDARDARSGAA